MNNLRQYLQERFDQEGELDFLDKEQKASIPLYLAGNYDFYRGNLAGRPIIWAKVKDVHDLSINRLHKQGDQLKRYLAAPIVFVFDKLPSWQRKRLIDKHIAFVEPPRQLYIPELLLELNDRARSNNPYESTKDSLRPSSQSAILYHLEVASIENRPLREIADLLKYSTMEVSRIVDELAHFSLIRLERKREKIIRFLFMGQELWNRANPLMRSPVREVWFTDDDLTSNDFRIGGDTGLAMYTMLSESILRTCCIGKRAFRTLKQVDVIKGLDKRQGDNRIEVWHYDPALLSKDKIVDRLSLYLSMREEKDERVQGALKDLINEISW